MARRAAGGGTGKPWRSVWVTRAQPAADATAMRVRALGLEALVEPLLGVQPIANAEIDLAGVSALAFTSANGVRAFAERSDVRDLRVFAVGDATAAAARAARFATILSSQGDVKTLAAAMVTRRRELTGAVLHPGAAELAGDLVGELAAAGIEARSVALYETVELAPSAALLERLPGLDGVLLHSPKAARALAKLLKASPAPQLVAVCLSRQIGRSLARAGLAGVLPARTPTELSLVERLADAAGKSTPA